MKSKKNLILGFLLLAFFAFVGYEMYATVRDEAISSTADQITRIKSEDVVKVHIQYGQMDFQVVKTGEEWQVLAPAEDMADTKSLVYWLDEVLGQEGRELQSGTDINWEQFGLNDPVGTVTVFAKKNKTYQVTVGTKDTFDRQTYLKVVEDGNTTSPKLYVSASRWRALILKNHEEFQDLSLMSWNVQRWKTLEQISWTRSKDSFALIKEDKVWTLKPDRSYPSDSAKIFSFLDDLRKFKSAGFVDETEAKSVVSQTPTLNIKAKFTGSGPEGEEQSLSFYNVTKSNPQDQFDYFVYNSLRNKWFGLNKSFLQVLSPDTVDFLDFQFGIDIKTAQKLIISSLGIYEKKNNLWQESKEMVSKAQNGLSFDGAKVYKFLSDLSDFKAERFEPSIEPAKKNILKEIQVSGEGWSKHFVIYNQVGSSIARDNLEDCYLVVEIGKDLPFWVQKKSVENLLLLEFYK